MSVTPTRPVSLSLTKPPSTVVTSKKPAAESLEEKQILSILENVELPILLVWENKTMNARQVSQKSLSRKIIQYCERIRDTNFVRKIPVVAFLLVIITGISNLSNLSDFLRIDNLIQKIS